MEIDTGPSNFVYILRFLIELEKKQHYESRMQLTVVLNMLILSSLMLSITFASHKQRRPRDLDPLPRVEGNHRRHRGFRFDQNATNQSGVMHAQASLFARQPKHQNQRPLPSLNCHHPKHQLQGFSHKR